VIAAAWIPSRSTGREPELTSRNQLTILNPGERQAQLEIVVFQADDDPLGPYRLLVAPRRLRMVRTAVPGATRPRRTTRPRSTWARDTASHFRRRTVPGEWTPRVPRASGAPSWC
jgi:hypothetical protein